GRARRRDVAPRPALRQRAAALAGVGVFRPRDDAAAAARARRRERRPRRRLALGPGRVAGGRGLQSRMAYRALDAERIERTIERLSQRVELRFPGSGLAGVVSELLGVAGHTVETTDWISKPLVPLRVGIGLLGLVILGGLAVSLS